jgi:hypothetical protein
MLVLMLLLLQMSFQTADCTDSLLSLVPIVVVAVAVVVVAVAVQTVH